MKEPRRVSRVGNGSRSCWSDPAVEAMVVHGCAVKTAKGVRMSVQTRYSFEGGIIIASKWELMTVRAWGGCLEVYDVREM